MQQPGKEPVELNPQQVLQVIQSQQMDLQRLTDRIKELEDMNAELQKRLVDAFTGANTVGVEPLEIKPVITERLKSEPEIEIRL